MMWFDLNDKVQVFVSTYGFKVEIRVEKQIGDTYDKRIVLARFTMRPRVAILLGRALINLGQHAGKRQYKAIRGEDS